MFISPRHHTFDLSNPLDTWEIEDKIDYFYAAIGEWHLEIANRCINGWKNRDGTDCIRTFDRQNNPANYIPDSGWAVLQIVLNYFEIIAFFKSDLKKDTPRLRFMWGVFDVFPEHVGKVPNVAAHLYEDLRTGLYHGTTNRGKTFLIHTKDSPDLIGDPSSGWLIIDPHRFVDRLQNHLIAYCAELRDGSNAVLRGRFLKAFRKKYG